MNEKAKRRTVGGGKEERISNTDTGNSQKLIYKIQRQIQIKKRKGSEQNGNAEMIIYKEGAYKNTDEKRRKKIVKEYNEVKETAKKKER